MEKLPDIFNDVIGPVMRGPSSSHTAASWRIAKMGLDLLNDELKSALIEFDKNGAWATNYREQGTTMGIEGGLLGLDMTAAEMKNTEDIALQRGVRITYAVCSFPTKHPNTIRLTLCSKSGETIKIVAVSLGGGSIEIQSINDFEVSLLGDYFELLLITNQSDTIENSQVLFPPGINFSMTENKDLYLTNCKSSIPFVESMLNKLAELNEVLGFYSVKPVMPIVAGNETELPFTNIQSIIEYGNRMSMDLGDLGLIYEKCQSGLTTSELTAKMQDLIQIMEGSIKNGLAGTKWNDRILPQQSHLINKALGNKRIISDTLFNQIIANVSSIMESKSAMEVIVANPTAGSCGTVAAVLTAVSERIISSKKDKSKAYFASGIIGAYFAKGPGFSAEEHGCQVECGASAGMAAAGIVQLLGGTPKQGFDAASMAIQNMIGLVCDPVADRVEVPCLGKNVSAAVNAYSLATMVLAGFDAVIPFDEVLNTVSRVSAMMPACHKCSGTGGLALTDTAMRLKKELNLKQLRIEEA